MTKLSKREKKLATITISVLVCVGGYFGVYQNLVDKWEELQNEIDARRMKLEASKQNYLEEQKIEEEYDQVVSSLRIEGSDSDKQIAIMQELSGLMREAGVVPRGAKPTNIIEEESYQIFNFSFDDIETNMVDLANFLALLEEVSKVSEIQQIEIKPPSPPIYDDGEQRMKMSFRISRLVYHNSGAQS
jgi:hypothetical protein